MGHEVPVASPATHARLPVIDTLRSGSALLIVLHHFSLYGPLARGLAHRLPQVSGGLSGYGRFAVYVFLVVAGFMAARGFAEWSVRPVVPACRLILQRYLRLVLPLAGALLLAVFAAAVARHWTTEDYVPGPATALQVLAHLGLLQGVLGIESLSTGVWYVAIELQLFGMVLLLLKARTGLPRRGLPAATIAALVCVSCWLWNGDPALDAWAPYFFAAYGLGVLAWWVAAERHQMRQLLWAGTVITVVVLLLFDWRGRMGVALATACLLARHGLSGRIPVAFEGVSRWLGERSYALFLVHFPVLLFANTALAEVEPLAILPPLIPLAASLGFSILLADAFHRWVERPCLSVVRQGWHSRAAALQWGSVRGAMTRQMRRMD